MPVAPVDEHGTVLYYEDSGPPTGSAQYVTLVLTHGTMFHAGTFRRMLPYAAQNNVRLILLNQREYPGSSPYTSTELEAVKGPDRAGQVEIIKTLGHQIGAFLSHLVEEHKLPAISQAADGKTEGGIALLTWSSGNSLLFSLLAHDTTLPEKTKKILETHFRTAVIYDPPLPVIGESPASVNNQSSDPASGFWTPFRDPSFSLIQKTQHFPIWASSYYAPPVQHLITIPPEEVDDYSEQTLKSLATRAPIGKTHVDYSTKPPTIERMTTEERAASMETSYWTRPSSAAFRFIPLDIYKENVDRTLGTSPASANEELVFPGLKLLLVWCDMTMSEALLAASILARKASRAPNGRKLHAARLEGANHFIHWDEPERVLRFLTNHI